MEFVEFITHQADNKIIDLINEKVSMLKPSLTRDTSTLYNKLTKNTETNQSIRKSFKFNVYNDELFAYVKVILSNILSNISTLDYNYQIIFDELELLVYEAGGFFLPHTDFEKLKSNTFQLYTMLIGLNSDVVGGETVLCCSIKDNPSKSNELKVFRETITKGGVLIFRNDLEHAGNVVMSGTKNVLKVNLLLHHKIKETDIDGLLIITNDNYANILSYDLFKNQTKSLLYESYINKKKVLKLDISSKEYEIMIKILSSNNAFELFMTNVSITKKLGLEYINQSIQYDMDNPQRSLIEKINEFLNSGDECIILPEKIMPYYKYVCDLKISNLIPIQLIYYSIRADGESHMNIDNKIGHFSIYDGLPIFSILCAIPNENRWTTLNHFYDSYKYYGYYEKIKLERYNPLYDYDFSKINNYKSARCDHYKISSIYDDDWCLDKFVAIEGSTTIEYLTNVVFLMRDHIVNDIKEHNTEIDSVNEDNFPNDFDKNIIVNGYNFIKNKFTSYDYFNMYFLPYLLINKKEIDTEHVEDSYWCNADGYYSVTLNSYVGFLKMK